MNLLQIKYFVDLAHSGHMTATAEKHMVSPSAISSSLKRMEDELGVPLFMRKGRNIVLNDYGKTYLSYAESALVSLEQAGAAIEDMKKNTQSSVALFLTNPHLYEEAVSAFRKKHPGINIYMRPFDAGIGKAKSLPPNADFIIASSSSIDDSGWDSQFLFNDKLYLAVPKNHIFSGSKTIDLADAKDEYFINSLSDTSFRTFCDELCRDAGFKPKSQIECDYLLRPKLLANENMVCITTSSGKNLGFFNDVELLQITNPHRVRPQSLFWKKDRYQTKAAKLFKNFLIDYYKDFKE